VLTIEGSLPAVRRAHFHVQEIFTDPSQLMSGSQGAFDGGFQQQQMQFNNGQTGPQNGYQQIQGSSMSNHGNNSGNQGGVGIPIGALTSLGVAHETVGQINELRNYLSRQFGLDLNVTQMGDYMQGQSQNGGTGSNIGVNDRRNPDEVTFQIPRNSVGGIIGKGGGALKDLQSEFGVKVYVEREEIGGMRLVVLKSLSNEFEESTRSNMLHCQERILSLIAQEQDNEK